MAQAAIIASKDKIRGQGWKLNWYRHV